MATPTASQFRTRIEDHFEQIDWDIVCRRRKSGYALYWDDDGEPLAKLRPVGRNDDVEVLQWKEDRWQSIAGDGVILRLDDALEFISEDPADVFFAPENEFSLARPWQPAVGQVAGAYIFLAALIGGAVGGCVAGPVRGGLVAVAAALLALAIQQLISGHWRATIRVVWGLGVFAVPLGGAAGVLGGSVNAALEGGVAGLVGGAVVGAACGFVGPMHWLPARLFGLAAGVLLGMQLVEAISVPTQFLEYVLVVLLASTMSRLLGGLVAWFQTAVRCSEDSSDGRADTADGPDSEGDSQLPSIAAE